MRCVYYDFRGSQGSFCRYDSCVITDQLATDAGALERELLVMTYLYDFGDNWKFQVLLERNEPADKKLKRSKLLEFHGKRPSQ